MSAQAGHALTQPTPRRVNCSEYFPLFLATLWVAGIFFHEGVRQRWGTLGRWGRVIPGWRERVLTAPHHLTSLAGAAALCGLFYLFARLRYFQGYARSAQLR